MTPFSLLDYSHLVSFNRNPKVNKWKWQSFGWLCCVLPNFHSRSSMPNTSHTFVLVKYGECLNGNSICIQLYPLRQPIITYFIFDWEIIRLLAFWHQLKSLQWEKKMLPISVFRNDVIASKTRSHISVYILIWRARIELIKFH